MACLFIDQRIGGVEVFGLAVVEDTAAEADDPAAQVDNRIDHPVAKLVIIAAPPPSDRHIGQLQLFRAKALSPQMLEKGVPRIGRISEAEPADNSIG